MERLFCNIVGKISFSHRVYYKSLKTRQHCSFGPNRLLHLLVLSKPTRDPLWTVLGNPHAHQMQISPTNDFEVNKVLQYPPKDIFPCNAWEDSIAK